MFTRQHLTRMIHEIDEAFAQAGRPSPSSEVISQVLLAQAVADAGQTISTSLDLLDKLSVEVADVSNAIRQIPGSTVEVNGCGYNGAASTPRPGADLS